MISAKGILVTLLFAVPILRSVSTSIEKAVEKTSIGAFECVDKRSRWCNKMLSVFPGTLAKKCKKEGTRVQVEFCCKTCNVLNGVVEWGAEWTAESRAEDAVRTVEKVATENVSTIQSATQYLMYTLYDSGTIYHRVKR